jgi:hypothetical protein
MYVMTCTHPNISHVVIMVSRFMGNLGKVYWHVVKWIFCYHKIITNVGLIYDSSSSTRGSVEGFLDSYYVIDLDKRRSLTVMFSLSRVCN